MKNKLEAIKKEFEQRISTVSALNELEEVKQYDRFIYNHMFDSKGYVKRFFEKK